VETVSTSIPIQTAHVRGAAQLSIVLPQLAQPDLGERSCGVRITDHRSSWTRLLENTLTSFYVKTYDYPTTRDRWRGALRNTGPLVRSRAAREFDALDWMRAQEIPTADPVGVLENRAWGLLHRAVLITRTFPGTSVCLLLPDLPPPERRELGRAVGELVGRLHRAGFRDRNLDPRNLLARRTDTGNWCVVKIDSPRYVLRREGDTEDALTRADWARLLPQLADFGIADSTYAAAREHRACSSISSRPADANPRDSQQ
jgi:hypothetical protein